MSGENYTEAMTTDVETPVPPQERSDPWVWAGVLSAVATGNLMRWLTDWSWWAYGAPSVGIAAVAVAYHWAKNRRREAEAAAAGR